MKRGRIIIFTLAGVCLIIGVAITFVVYEVLFVAGAISETKKLHSFRLDTDVVADVYLVRHFENYECAFEVRTNNHRIAIPKTQFRGEHYWGSVVGRSDQFMGDARPLFGLGGKALQSCWHRGGMGTQDRFGAY
jgi:hypothetical protein